MANTQASRRAHAHRDADNAQMPPPAAERACVRLPAAASNRAYKWVMYTAVMVCVLSVLVVVAWPQLHTRLPRLPHRDGVAHTSTATATSHVSTHGNETIHKTSSNDHDSHSDKGARTNNRPDAAMDLNYTATHGPHDGSRGDATAQHRNDSAMTADIVAAAATSPRTVVVVGGGLAGCTAAIEAANCGAQVILLEKEARLGGNSAKATSGINGWGTRAQAEQGVDDTAELFEGDTYRSGRGGNCDPGLVRMLSVKSADAIRWLTSLGVPLTVLSQLGGASRKRCHRAPDKSDGTPVPIGFMTLRTLDTYIRTNMSTRITVVTNARMLRLLSEQHTLPSGEVATRVTSVEYERTVPLTTDQVTANGTHATPQPHAQKPPQQQQQQQRHVDANVTREHVTQRADAVILATGGFSNDHTDNSLLREYAPDLASFPTTNGAWATGDGVKMARDLGVALVDMDKVQLHPTGFIDPKDPANRTKYLGPEALRGSGGVLINKSGERFVNELDLRSVVSQAIIAQNNEFPGSGGSKFAYCVLNEAAATLFGKNALGFYWKRLGLFEKVNDVAELAKLIGCPEATLHMTLSQYEKASSQGSRACTVTGKTVFPCVLGPQGPFYVSFVTPSIHYTMGGCLISPSAEILSNTTRPLGGRLPILGLFGAGEVTGGVHGQNRLGGNSLLECVVFGKVAGRRAAQTALLPSTDLFADADGGKRDARARVTVRAVVPESGAAENATAVRDAGAMVELELPTPLQRTGLSLLQPVMLRKDGDGDGDAVCLLPTTAPSEVGVVGLHVPRQWEGAAEWLYTLQPGDAVNIRPGHANATGCERLGGPKPFDEVMSQTRRLYIVATELGGAAAALHLSRAALSQPLRRQLEHARLLFICSDHKHASARRVRELCAAAGTSTFFQCTFIKPGAPTGDFFASHEAPKQQHDAATVVAAGAMLTQVAALLLDEFREAGATVVYLTSEA